MTIEAVQTFGSRSTVAQRKEASELRRTLKPLMEKKRRARINDSLNDLKSLILPLVGKDVSIHTRVCCILSTERAISFSAFFECQKLMC